MDRFESNWKELSESKHPLDTNIYQLEANLKQSLDQFQASKQNSTNAIFQRELKRSLFKLLSYKRHEASTKAIAAALTLISNFLQFELYDDPASNTMTICGKLFVIDVLF
jgi:sugar (pentulose or hexulose) kinase